MELVHFSHEHPLILNKEPEDEHTKFHCYGCGTGISGTPYYSCSLQCKFFLHKLCADLPAQMQHPQHSLTLLANPAANCRWRCDVCPEYCRRFFYHCSICNFKVDTGCALMAQTIEHKGHHHPLSPIQTLAVFPCHACRQIDAGYFFRCITCRFWIHQRCAFLPETIEVSSHHDHPLTLYHSLPPECSKFPSYCDICHVLLEPKGWVYYCADCRYHVHLNCATRKIESLTDHNNTSDTSIHLPVESIDLVTQLIEKISLKNNEKATELNHKSHQHPLIIFDAQSKDDQSGPSWQQQQQSLFNEVIDNNDVFCEGCMSPISTTPFYSCPDCRFFLHKWCAELPDELQHPGHPEHPLVLLTKPPELFDAIRCDGCACLGRGFIFSCARCQFNLDLKCASLPGSIRHEGHKKHNLILMEKPNRWACSACMKNVSGFAYGCHICKWQIDANCALLPGNARHRYDKHPFLLTNSPIQGVKEYICPICEGDVNPKFWFYHCIPCDLSMHTSCLFPLPKECSDCKVRDIIHPNYHSYRLTVCETRKDDDASCDCCSKNFDNHSLAFKCYSFKLHLECALLPEKVRHECHRHCLTLTSLPIKGHSNEYPCRICKLEIDRKLFYHCGYCDHSVHATCLANIKLHGILEDENAS